MAPRVVAARVMPARSRARRCFPHAVSPVRAHWPRRRGLVLQEPLTQLRYRSHGDRRYRDRPHPRRGPSAVAPAADAPLTQAPAVTDDTPATVIADDRGRTVVTEAPLSAGTAPQATVPPPTEVPLAGSGPSACTGCAVLPRAGPGTRSPVDPAPIATAPSGSAAGPARFAFQQQAMSVREGDVAARIVIRRSGDLSRTARSPGGRLTARPLPTAILPTSVRASSASSQARRAARSSCRSRTTPCRSRRGTSASCSTAAPSCASTSSTTTDPRTFLARFRPGGIPRERLWSPQERTRDSARPEHA